MPPTSALQQCCAFRPLERPAAVARSLPAPSNLARRTSTSAWPQLPIAAPPKGRHASPNGLPAMRGQLVGQWWRGAGDCTALLRHAICGVARRAGLPRVAATRHAGNPIASGTPQHPECSVGNHTASGIMHPFEPMRYVRFVRRDSLISMRSVRFGGGEPSEHIQLID